jgi:hypothetical protein
MDKRRISAAFAGILCVMAFSTLAGCKGKEADTSTPPPTAPTNLPPSPGTAGAAQQPGAPAPPPGPAGADPNHR